MKMFLSLLILVAFLAIALSDEVIASMTSPVIKTDASAQKVETVRTKEEELAALKFEAKPSSYYNKAANRDNQKTKYVSKRNLGAVSTTSGSKYKHRNGNSSGHSSDSSNCSKRSLKSNKSGSSGGSNKSNKSRDKCLPGGKKFGNPKYCPVGFPTPAPVAPTPAPVAPTPAPVPPRCPVSCPTEAPVCTPTCSDP
jgi:hypothetical protein